MEHNALLEPAGQTKTRTTDRNSHNQRVFGFALPAASEEEQPTAVACSDDHLLIETSEIALALPRGSIVSLSAVGEHATFLEWSTPALGGNLRIPGIAPFHAIMACVAR